MILKRNLLSAALASAILMAAASAQAHAGDPAASSPGAMAISSQQVPPASTDQDQTTTTQSEKDKAKKKAKATTLGAVEVVGFAASVQNSTAIKRNSSAIVEAVSAEQIGKLPGISIADTLGRLPGLAVQTVSGRPQVLSIHGLGPDFSTALINGGQQVSTSNNRDVQFDQYPSSWFGSVVVHLSPSANLIGQGLSGTVDMHTIRPLDAGKPIAAINVHYIWDGMDQLATGRGVKDHGYHVNGVWVHQFADNTFGVTLGVDLDANPSQIQHQAPWGYPADANGDLVIGGSKNYGISDLTKRNGVLATVQWRPSEYYTGTIDVTLDNFKETQQLKGMEMPLFWGNGSVAPSPTLVPGNVVNGFVQSGTWQNINTVVRNDYNTTTARVYNFNFDNQFYFNENWSATVDANYSRATRDDVNLESYSGTGYYLAAGGHGASDNIQFWERDNGLFYVQTMLDYTQGMLLTDPQAWGAGATPSVVQAGFINAPHTVDYLGNLRLAVTRSFASGPISSLEFGVDRATRNKTYSIDQTFLLPPGGAETAPIPGATTGDPLAWMGVGPQVIYDPVTLIQNGDLVGMSTVLSSIAVPPNWKVREQDVTSYLQANLDTYLGDVYLRGNFGVQVAHTSQSSTGQYVAASAGGTNGSNAVLLPSSGGISYTRWLPSANLVFGLTSQDDLRIGLARTMMRPRMDQMSASMGLNTNITRLSSTDPNQAYFSASGGNAELLPTMANNFNISYEHYFGGDAGYQCNSADAKNSDLCRAGSGGYVALSGYYLKLTDFINPNSSFLHDFSAYVPAYLTPAQQAQLGTSMGIISGPDNGGEGHVKGLQLTLNLPMAVLTPSLRGFGVILTGNRTSSELLYPGNPNPITVPGLSKWVANGTLYFQHGGFQARVSQSYRSTFLGRVSGISATRIQQFIDGGSTFSAQLSYTIHDGAMKGLGFVLQGSNLSDKIFTTYQTDPRQIQTWERYGRRYEVGVTYKF